MQDFYLLAIILLLVDSVYISSVSSFYGKIIYKIQGSKMKLNLISTILCYITLISGIYYFVIMKNMTYIDALLLGWFVYGVFEFTNMALFNKWTWTSVFIDTTWGGILFLLTYYIFNNVKIYL